MSLSKYTEIYINYGDYGDLIDSQPKIVIHLLLDPIRTSRSNLGSFFWIILATCFQEIIAVNGTLDTPAGIFDQVLTRRDYSIRTRRERIQVLWPGIGLIQDEAIKLVNYTKS
jgi:hypothetical protein